MSNCEVFDLTAIEVELHQVCEVLRAMLHTILFQRSLGQQKPRDVDSELFELTYVHCGDAAVEARLEAKIDEAVAFFERKAPSQDLCQLTLSFFEQRRRQPGLGFWAKGDERLYWERWVVNLAIAQSDDTFSQDHHSLAYTSARSVRQAQRQAQLESVLLEICSRCSEKRGHIPPVTSASVVSYAFDIAVAAGGSRLADGLGRMKRLLLAGSPPALC